MIKIKHLMDAREADDGAFELIKWSAVPPVTGRRFLRRLEPS